ncbi:MAG TPA: UbiA family prenyltransferase [bacterium]|nr:UbiA family prenyltransferase [bacterium]
MRKLADILFLVRPPLLAASATFFFAGALSSHRVASGHYSVALMLGALPGLGIFLAIVALSFVVNQVFDIKSDAINRKNFILPSQAVSRRESFGFAGLLAAAIAVLCLGRGGEMRLLAGAGVVLGVAYSVPPLRLKAKPIADLVVNTVGFGWIGFLMGWLAFGELGREALARSSPYAIAMAAIFLNTCIPDEAGDRAAGDRTTCVVFGKRVTATAALVLLAGAAVAGVLLDELVVVIAALGAVPAFISVAADPNPANSVLASQLAARILFVLLAVMAPLLAAVGVAAYVVSKIYYMKRFGIDYPRLTGASLEAPAGSDGKHLG